MAKKVSTQTIIPHFCAFCSDCEWVYQDCRNREKGFFEIRKHVKETGHSVTLEKGVHTIYTLDGSERANTAYTGQAASGSQSDDKSKAACR